ncbi:ABC transporter permease [Clostridium sp. Marseille-Q2269]|uniref:ABC transporter permease n=1 Tax=Clostridium sp. Marseille-Q2269 TaxID=2942205 RepID=UPI002073004E|nr:ABC transporter permease [Clostridium sp. Marseille-Q2269]
MTLRYIFKRLGQGILIIFFLSIISFLIINAAPGDPAVAIYGGKADRLNNVERSRIIKNYGLDRPLIERYIKWTGEMIKGDMGISYIEGRPVSEILKEKVPNTMVLFINSIFLISLISIILGLKAGFNEGSIWDKLLSVLSIVFYSIPPFWLALIFILVFSVYGGLLPSSGNMSVDGDGSFLDVAKHAILPISVIVITHVGAYSRFIQEKVKEENRSYYAMVARANGSLENNIRRGITKNALIPFINYLGITIPTFFSGSVMIETVFSWPGLGMLTVKAANSRDYPLLMGAIFITGVLVVLCMIVTDIIEIILNPHLRK